ncbi:hypothetical protein J6590_085191 [Homalodisca vitripennis]|nr:hypothetical protein J6590_085191 [Homalodisca vitripennis]
MSGPAMSALFPQGSSKRYHKGKKSAYIKSTKFENNDLESTKSASTQTSDDSNSPLVAQSSSVYLEILLLKKRQDQMEQTIQKLSDGIHHQCCNNFENIMPTKHSSPCIPRSGHRDSSSGKTHFHVKKSSTDSKNKTKRKNLFSISLQAANNREARLKCQTLDINKISHDAMKSTDDDGDKPTTHLVAPIIHTYEDGTFLIQIRKKSRGKTLK